jgi:hypothetical protein
LCFIFVANTISQYHNITGIYANFNRRNLEPLKHTSDNNKAHRRGRERANVTLVPYLYKVRGQPNHPFDVTALEASGKYAELWKKPVNKLNLKKDGQPYQKGFRWPRLVSGEGKKSKSTTQRKKDKRESTEWAAALSGPYAAEKQKKSDESAVASGPAAKKLKKNDDESMAEKKKDGKKKSAAAKKGKK